MVPVLNIIHLQERTDRRQSFTEQMIEQVASPYRVWYGMVDPVPWKGISRSHKQIVQFAKNRGEEFCIIAEDDVKFTSKKSWQTFLKKMPREFDLYLGGISGGEVIDEKTGQVLNFSGMFLYIIHQRFYDCFLSADEDKNIDRWLSGKGLDAIIAKLGRQPVYKVCYPIIAICIDGVSNNSKGPDGQWKFVDHKDCFSQYKKLL